MTGKRSNSATHVGSESHLAFSHCTDHGVYRHSIHNIINTASARKIECGSLQSLHHWTDRFCSAKPLCKLVADIPGIQIGKYENVCVTSNIAPRRFLFGDRRNDRRVELHLTV